MKISLQRLCSRFIDLLGVVTFIGVALSLAIPGLMPVQVRAMVTLPTASAMASVDHANCLWYTARNQGFYSLQHAVATGSGTEANRVLWMQLVESVEPSICGSQPIDSKELTRALAETVNDADKHFMAKQRSW